MSPAHELSFPGTQVTGEETTHIQTKTTEAKKEPHSAAGTQASRPLLRKLKLESPSEPPLPGASPEDRRWGGPQMLTSCVWPLCSQEGAGEWVSGDIQPHRGAGGPHPEREPGTKGQSLQVPPAASTERCRGGQGQGFPSDGDRALVSGDKVWRGRSVTSRCERP